MLREMSSAELTEWIAYARVEPFGPDVDDYRAGIGASVNVNIHRKEGASAITPFDLMPWREKAPEPELTPEEITARQEAIFKQFAKPGSLNG